MYAQSQLLLVRKQHKDRARQIIDVFKRVETAVERADESGNAFVTSWENQTEKVAKATKLFQHSLDCKETDWTEDIKVKYDCFAMKGQDDARGKLGVNFHVDMNNMRARVKEAYFQLKMENLLKAKWFIVILVKLKEKIETVFTPIPMSCFKFLLAMKEIFILGQEVTKPVFFALMEATIAHDDHRDVVVHRTLKSIRDVLHIHPDTFLEYLERKEIQPSPELLSQVRAYRKKMVNESKLKGLSASITSGKASMLSHNKPRRWGPTVAQVLNMNNSQPSTRPSSAEKRDAADAAIKVTQNVNIETVVLQAPKLEKQVTFSEGLSSALGGNDKHTADNIAEVATELWRQKHALLMRHNIASCDDRNSAMFSTPQTSFEVFGAGMTSSMEGESGNFFSLDGFQDNDDEGDNDDEEEEDAFK
jgi:hypothetical protein